MLVPASGQTGINYNYNYNIYNGLPSNHIYDIITDRHGYLWLATDRGVVKYNGYEFRIFGTSDGLPTNDVWQLMEDNKGRIWLGNITDQVGYLLNDHYHKSYIKNYNSTIYPMDLRPYKDGIIFMSSHNDDFFHSICTEKNDTIVYHPLDVGDFELKINNERLGIKTNNKSSRPWLRISTLGKPIILYKSILFKYNLDNLSDPIQQIFKIDTDFFNKHILYNNGEVMIGDYFAAYSTDKSDSKLYLINTEDGKTSELDISKYCEDANIYYVSPRKDKKEFYVVTRNNITTFGYSNGISLIKNYKIHELVSNPNLDGDKLYAFGNFPLWNLITGSTTNGCYMAYDFNNNFIPYRKTELKDFELCGNFPGEISFWWNGTLKTLIQIEPDGKATSIKMPSVSRIYSISKYHKDTFLINSYSEFAFIPKKKLVYKINKSILTGPIQKLLIKDTSNFLMIGAHGIYKQYIININDTTKVTLPPLYFKHDKFAEFLFDSVNNNIVSYNYKQLFIYTKSDTAKFYNCNQNNFGVKTIQQLVIDNLYGNYFFKGLNNISAYNVNNNSNIEILNNLNTKDSKLCIYRNKLIVVGRFGVAFCKINGRLEISQPLIYHNFKSINYKYIYYCVALNGKVLINTDKGAFEVSIPSDSEISQAPVDNTLSSARLIYIYQDSLQNFKTGDTIIMNQTERKIQFDVINPYGDGQVAYNYKFPGDADWHELNADELNIPDNFQPGNYYTLLLKINDDVWNSNPISINIYIKPYWSQTSTGRGIILTCLFAGIIFLVFIIVIVTRLIVINISKRRTLRMELELKAMYAQINPHFIFNSLNSALLLVSKKKMDEAYEHISKFSRLLRGYLKSSRNKLISITEEIVNLRDYMELQQTRFKNKFEYQIIFEPGAELENFRIPSLLLQPFVENAINHGILPMEEPGLLKIIFTLAEENKTLTCTIDDNGIGRKKSKENNEKNKLKEDSYGDLLIKDLVSIFNRFEDMNIEIKYTDKDAPETGTIVTIKIKNLKNVQ